MSHYIRIKDGYEIEWNPPNAEIGYQAIVQSSNTDIETIEEAKSTCPIIIKETPVSIDIRTIYNNLDTDQNTDTTK